MSCYKVKLINKTTLKFTNKSKLNINKLTNMLWVVNDQMKQNKTTNKTRIMKFQAVNLSLISFV